MRACASYLPKVGCTTGYGCSPPRFWSRTCTSTGAGAPVWFLDLLVDGDLASNNHGWQWVAGTGTDAAPFHRVFNPAVQAERFDPDAAYVARYVPESGGFGYPAPMVDHASERREALSRWEEAGLALRAVGTDRPGRTPDRTGGRR